MKTLIAIGCFAVAMQLLADDKEQKPSLNADQRVAQLGGFVVRPGSLKGSVTFVDTQQKVAIKKAFDEVVGYFNRQLPVKIDYVKAEFDDFVALKAKAKTNFAIILVDDEKLPSMTIYPDDGIAVVNFAKYTTAFKLPDDQAMFEKRCAKGALKAFVMLCNGGGSRYPGNVATARNPAQLDFASEKLPVDIQEAMKKYLESAGVTPMRRTVYRKACEEGWAPAPTNDVQKAIWDKVHAMPTEPIKIKPETKKQEK